MKAVLKAGLKRTILLVVLLAATLTLGAATVYAQGEGQDVITYSAAALAGVAFLATAGEAIVEGLVAPVFDKYSLDKFWLMYAAWIVTGILVMLSGANVFDEYIPSYPLVGRVVTALIAGRGSNFIHDLFSSQVKRGEQAKVQSESLQALARLRDSPGSKEIFAPNGTH